MKEGRTAIAMSGGLDSSAAAALLQSQGHDVFGLTAQMRPVGSRCRSDKDILSAKKMAAHLGIPHYVADLSEAFERDVVKYLADEYAAGRTPSPCAVCNPTIKFGALLDEALRLGASHLATGHYARVVVGASGERHLLRGVDADKDQSYFLFDLSQRQLGLALFPLGGMTKGAVREFSSGLGLPEPGRSESQDLCFARPGEYWKITEQHHPNLCRSGTFVDVDGALLGRHEGIHHFTIGQRRGLGVAVGKRLYVAALHGDTQEVVLAERHHLFGKGLTVHGLRWTSGVPRDTPFRAGVKIRYNHDPVPSLIVPGCGGAATVRFDEPQFAVTPGQVAAFYDGEELVGGGWIAAAAEHTESS